MVDLFNQLLEGKEQDLAYKSEALTKEAEKLFSGEPHHLMLKWPINVTCGNIQLHVSFKINEMNFQLCI